MQEIDNGQDKKSLMNSLNKLNSRAYELEELNNFSYGLLKKFTNPRSETEEDKVDLGIKDSKVRGNTPDLIDLFNEAIDNIIHSTGSIRKNLESISNIVD